RGAVLAARPLAVVEVAFDPQPALRLVQAQEADGLELVLLGPVARVVAELGPVAEAALAERSTEGEAEITRGIDPIQVRGGLLDVTKAPERLFRVEGQRGRDAQQRLLLAEVVPAE